MKATEISKASPNESKQRLLIPSLPVSKEVSQIDPLCLAETQRQVEELESCPGEEETASGMAWLDTVNMETSQTG